MHVAKFILYDVARKVDSCNIARKVDAVLREKSLLQVVPCNITLKDKAHFCLSSSFYPGHSLSAVHLKICPLRPKFVKSQQTIHTCKALVMTENLSIKQLFCWFGLV